MIAIGQEAPDFTLPNQNGVDLCLCTEPVPCHTAQVKYLLGERLESEASIDKLEGNSQP